MQQGKQEVPHVRASVGQTWGAEQRGPILDSAREFPIRDAQGTLSGQTDYQWLIPTAWQAKT